MSFYPPSWLSKFEDPPDTVTIHDFMLDEIWGRHPLGYARNPFTCGLSGKTYSMLEVKERTDYLARGLAKELGWSPNNGNEWDKVIGVFSLNSLDTIPLAWATHRLGGIQTPANAVYGIMELVHQLKDSGAKCLFTCVPLLKTSLEAAAQVGIPKNRIYLLQLPKEAIGGQSAPSEYKSVDDLIKEGSKQPRLEPLKLQKGDGAKRTAFLCYSSGTSGLPKGVMISHHNVIANTLQIKAYETKYRESKRQPGTFSEYSETVLGLLPMSHIYGLVVICHSSIYRGDQVIVLPRFEFNPFCAAIQNYKINTLFLVPPIIINMVNNKKSLDQYDLSSVESIFTGAAPLGKEVAEDLSKMYPKWIIRQGYGLTETCTVVCSSAPHDIFLGSCGSLLPGYEARIVTIEGTEITGYDQPGELIVKSPSIVLGYLNNEKANKETFQDGFMRTGDEALIRKNPETGYEHIFIVDRIKELIKVKGMQVAPAELEAHLLTHPLVADCAVISVPDDAAGEAPKAFVVKSSEVGLEDSESGLRRSITKHVEKHKARHKWLKGGVEFIDAVPKSPSGKILRRMLRDKDREARRQKGARL
ncbi:MAG: hypothetical protein M1820_002099 [Bogoriella megaspora]|nr:MAG: hypothetical protein M1820_002099 [Bogoriella megaspora]